MDKQLKLIEKVKQETTNINIGLNSSNKWLRLLELSLKGGRNA